jgi:hypothetical protein
MIKPRALKGQFLPLVERANPPKNKLFDVVARLKTDIAESDHAIHQSLKPGGSRCLLGHWGALTKSTWNHLREEPFQQFRKVAFGYSSRQVRHRVNPKP